MLVVYEQGGNFEPVRAPVLPVAREITLLASVPELVSNLVRQQQLKEDNRGTV